MKKSLMVHCGCEEPTTKIMAAWDSWFAKVGDGQPSARRGDAPAGHAR